MTKILAVFLFAAFAFTAGCGGGDEPGVSGASEEAAGPIDIELPDPEDQRLGAEAFCAEVLTIEGSVAPATNEDYEAMADEVAALARVAPADISETYTNYARSITDAVEEAVATDANVGDLLRASSGNGEFMAQSLAVSNWVQQNCDAGL